MGVVLYLAMVYHQYRERKLLLAIQQPDVYSTLNIPTCESTTPPLTEIHCALLEHATSLCNILFRLLEQYLKWIDFRLEGEDPGISSTLDFEKAYYHVNLAFWSLL